MASREMEGPLLGIKTHKGGSYNWLARGLGSTSRVLTLSPETSSPFWPKNISYTSWEKFEDGQLAINSPDASYSAVYLTDLVNKYSLEDQKKLVAEAARVTMNGGHVTAYHPACDDAEEVYKLAKSYGLDVEDFLSQRMTNRGIMRLKPHTAAFFQSLNNIPNKNRLVEVMLSMGLEASLEHMWTVKEKFAVRRFYVGMTWIIERK